MPAPMSVYSVLTPGTEFQAGRTMRTEDQRRAGVRNVLKSPLVFLAVCLNLIFALFVLLILSNATRQPTCEENSDIQATPAAPIDKSFHRHGSYDHHRYDENCHYDHALNVLIVDLTGDGYGENATVVYDFSRRLMTYGLTRKRMCLIGVIDESIDVGFVHDGDSVTVPETAGSRFTSTGTIPLGFLRLNTSPIVASVCADFETHWIEPEIESSRVRVARHHHHSTTTTTTTTTTANGKTTTTTTTTTTSIQ